MLNKDGYLLGGSTGSVLSAIRQYDLHDNNANIIALPARYISEEIALRCVDIFLNTGFEGGRHEARVNKIKC